MIIYSIDCVVKYHTYKSYDIIKKDTGINIVITLCQSPVLPTAVFETSITRMN